MVKKNTNEHDYFKNIKDFLTYHFNKTPGNETKLANVLEYCKLNWKSIVENEVAYIENKNVKTFYWSFVLYILFVAIERLGQVYV